MVKRFLPCFPGYVSCALFIDPYSTGPASRVVTGKVTDEKGGGLSGVSAGKGTSGKGTTTNARWQFMISVSSEADKLTFSYVGYKVQNMPVSGKTTFNIQLEPGIDKAMADVVMLGYGTQKKASVTGAVCTVKGGDIVTSCLETDKTSHLMRHHFRTILFLILLISGSGYTYGQNDLNRVVAGFPVNYSEDSVGTYTLPNVLTLQNGRKVNDARTWNEKRRPEIVQLFEEHQFGKMPAGNGNVHFNVFDKGTAVFGGKAIRKQVTVYFTKDTSDHKMDLLIYLPASASKPSPLLLIINFSANANAVDDPGVKQGEVWTREGKKVPASQSRAFSKINIDTFVSQGIGVATVYYGDIEPDFKSGIKYGIRSLYLKPGMMEPAADEWGAISAWAWGLSRAMDYFETDKQIDAKRIALQGTSRLGKTVLWAGAHDTRFKMVIASCSGEGGAAISRRNYGENIKHMTDTSRYYYQFAPKWHSYADDFNRSPVDAHMLVALMAPRPLLLQTGDTDYWSDPKGEFLAAVAAGPVYNLFSKKGPGTAVMPKAGDQTMLNTLGYYMHAGGHGTIPSDWPVFIGYIKKYL